MQLEKFKSLKHLRKRIGSSDLHGVVVMKKNGSVYLYGGLGQGLKDNRSIHAWYSGAKMISNLRQDIYSVKIVTGIPSRHNVFILSILIPLKKFFGFIAFKKQEPNSA